MKPLIIGLLFTTFTTGLLMAQEQTTQPQHLTESQRRALRSQSPQVRTHSRRHLNKDTAYHVTENKTTITATIPYGK
ncbi:MAG: hypothetical protein ABSG13_10730 [Bryobacteraceae bacterium]|jgi:hypothetical protein